MVSLRWKRLRIFLQRCTVLMQRDVTMYGFNHTLCDLLNALDLYKPQRHRVENNIVQVGTYGGLAGIHVMRSINASSKFY